MASAKAKIVDGGRVILPAAFRRSLGLSKGDTVLIELEGDELRIRSARAALRDLQRKLRDFGPSDGTVSRELIDDRRREAAMEQE